MSPTHFRGFKGLQKGQVCVSPSKPFLFSFSQNYLRKQVTPLFDYFETITKNWTEHPQTLMEQ